MKLIKIFAVSLAVGMALVVLVPETVRALTGGTTNLISLVRVFADSDLTTPNVATAAGELYVEGDIEADGNLNVAGTSTLTGGVALTGDLTVTGNDITFGNAGTISNATNGAITIGEASEDLIATFTADALVYTSSTAVASVDWQIASFIADALTLSSSITLSDGATIDQSADTIITLAEASEDLELTFGSDAISVGSTTGVLELNFASIALEAATVATTLQVIRFCGNGSASGAADYMGPVLEDVADDMTIYNFSGSGCDGLNDPTEGTADAVWHPAFAFKPVAMVCTGLCTGSSAANDAITYQLRDDTADVTGMTCTAGAWTGDGTIKQCSVRDGTPATVAAGSAIAIKTIGTDDACADAGDDFECRLYVTF